MKSIPLRLFLLAASSLLSVIPCLAAPHQHVVFAEQHFECTVPGNWVVNHVDAPSFSFSAVDPQYPEAGQFVVFAKPEGTEHVESPEFQNLFKDQLRQSGFEIVSEDSKPFEGYTAYSCLLRMVRNGVTEDTRSINFVAGNIHYCINVRQGGGDRAPAAEGRKILASFKILPAR